MPRSHVSWNSTDLTLGTAQLGIEGYGRTNVTGRPDSAVAAEMIRTALHSGINCIDTARSYDRAESIIGMALKNSERSVCVITKLSVLSHLGPDSPREDIRAAVDQSVFDSCRELRQSRLQVLLLHRWRHRAAHGNAVWERLLELKQAGSIGDLGASVSSPDEAAEALMDPEIRWLQIPFNILDHRWKSARIDTLAANRRDVVIHARSVLLQGILGASADYWPILEAVSPQRIIAKLDRLALRLGRKNRVDLCIAYARSHSWLHSLVMGVDNIRQLKEVVAYFRLPVLTSTEREDADTVFRETPEALLNPAQWPGK